MNEHKDKDQSELRAYYCLCLCLGFDENTLVIDDKPDLQDKVHGIGVEVTQDVYSLEKKNYSISQSIFCTPVDEVPPKKLEILRRGGGSFREENNRFHSISLGEATQNNPMHLIETIKGKQQKFSTSKYTRFSTNALFVFVETMTLFSSYIQTVITEAQANNDYDRLYLYGHNAYGAMELVICNIRTKNYERVNISKEMREEIEKKVKEHGYRQDSSRIK